MHQPNPTLSYRACTLEEVAGRSGLDFLRAIISGELPRPPINKALNFWLAEAEQGRAVFEGEPTEEHFNPIGTVHGGWAATLLDSALACAVQTTLKPGQIYTSVEMKLNFDRPVMPGKGVMRCEATVVQAGSRIATSEGRLVDQAGKLLAHGTETCLIMEARPAR
jgi:uncharacterized protein (TIGR00369 family)